MKKYRYLLIIIMFNFLFLSVPLRAQILTVPLVIQEQTNWCWAASSKCFLDYFGFSNDQCTIAEYTRTVATWHNFGTVNCCADPTQGCNYWNYMWGDDGSIQDILLHFGNLQVFDLGTYLSLSQIQSQMADGRPFIFRWGWSTGGGHFLVGHGISDSTMYYMNPLPGYGFEISDYNWVVEGSNHTWTHTQTLCLPPDQPGAISGDTNVCQASSQIYSIIPVSGAMSYWWTLPSGWSGGSTSENIIATAGSSGGTISVVSNSSCGTSMAQTLPVTVYKVDTSVTVNSSSLTCHANPAYYQWIRWPSMQIIGGETNQKFTPAQNGTYAVIVTQNSCTDTSGCHTIKTIGLNYTDNTISIVIYPNPANDVLTIKCKGLSNDNYKMILTNTLGQRLNEQDVKTINNTIETQFEIKEFSMGIYFLIIRSTNIRKVFRVEKQ